MIIDNENVVLIDKIKELLPESKKVRIATGYFYIDGFNLVRDNFPFELNDHFLEIIMGRETTELTKFEVSVGYAQRRGESVEAEILEKITQRIDLADKENVKTLYELILNKKADIYIYTGGILHAKAYLFIDRPELLNDPNAAKSPGVAIVGSSNFTRPGITTNRELNIHTTEGEDIRNLNKWYEGLLEKCQEFNDDLIKVIKGSGILTGKPVKFGLHLTPKELFMVFAYEILDGKISLLKKDNILAIFQEIGVVSAEQKIKKYGGALISDSVGLGKSFIGAQIIYNYFYNLGTAGDFWDRELEEKWKTIGKKVLCIIPPNLIDQWRDEYFKTFVFANHTFEKIGDKEHYRITKQGAIEGEKQSIGEVEFLSYNLFTRLSPDEKKHGVYTDKAQNDRKILKDYADNYDLILIDEAQGFRDEKSKAWRNIQELQNKTLEKKPGERIRNKFILISATPLNNRLSDLFNIFRIFLDKDYVQLKNWGIDSGIFKRYEQDRDEYYRLIKEGEKSEIANAKERLKISSDKIRSLLGELMILRTRKYIQMEYGKDVKIDGKPLIFKEPTVKKIEYTEHVTVTYQNLYKCVVDSIGKLTLNYIEVVKGSTDSTEVIKALLSTLLLKRVESSIYALERTVKKMEAKERLIKDILSKAKGIEEAEKEWDKLFDENIGEGYKISLEEIKNLPEIIAGIDTDLEIFNEIKNAINAVKIEDKKPFPEYNDPKLIKLKEKLSELLVGENKVIVFTQYKDTADYIYNKIIADPFLKKVKMNIVTGGLEPHIKRSRAASFIPTEEDDGTKLLISTDALSEGVNLQRGSIVINYDLPWNPMRIVQRVGRVNRIGSENDILVLNFFPDSELQARIELINILKRKIHDINHLLVKEIQILSEDEEFDPEDAAKRIFQTVSTANPTEIEGAGARGETTSQIFGEEEQTKDKIILWNKIKELGLKDEDFNFIQKSTGPFYTLCDFGTTKLYQIFDTKRNEKMRNFLLSLKDGKAQEIKFREIIELSTAIERKGFDSDLYRKLGELDKKAEVIVNEEKAKLTSDVTSVEMGTTQKAVCFVLSHLKTPTLAKYLKTDIEAETRITEKAEKLLQALKKSSLSSQEIGHLKNCGREYGLLNMHEKPKKSIDKENYLKSIESFIENFVKTRAGRTDEVLRKEADISLKSIGWCD